jgi:hypothetical protein
MRSLLLSAFLFLQLCLSAQDISMPSLELPRTKGTERNAQALVNRLTAGKSSDKEKFDAIFVWVAKNIRYNYAAYLSPRGATAPNLKRILKRKSGICLDYAFLMDTLCTLAGIQNVSVYGYAKDDLFDVGDSLYMDNHAWNAVKLDNYWYVYDVTWSAGQYVLQLRRFSQFIVNVEHWLYSKKRPVTITFRSKRNIECDPSGGKFTQTYDALPAWCVLLLKITWRIPLRVHWVHDKDIHTEFYLSDPETFAITHIPDDPYWSLTANNSKIRTFETDSAFYHLDDSTYLKQERESKLCGQCDSYFSLDDMARQKQMKRDSREFNPRNHFVPWLADYNIGDIFFKRSFPLVDSASKIQQIDSALSYYAMAKDELKQCSRDVNKESQLQRAKNANKMKILNAENKAHISYIHGIKTSTNKATGKMKKFSGRTRVTELRLRADKSKLHDLKIKTHPYNNKDNVILMQKAYDKEMIILDSLNTLISSQRESYSNMLVRLSDNLWRKGQTGDSLTFLFLKGSSLRKGYLLDNYKKIMVENRKNVQPMEKLYASDLGTSIYELSDSCADLGMSVYRAMDKRDALLLQAGRLLNVLVNEGMVDKDSLKNYTHHYNEEIQENICWLTSGSSKLKAILTGYDRMLKKQKFMEDAVRSENRAEFSRYRQINAEIVRRKIKYGSIPPNNMKVCSAKRSFVKQYRKNYLNKLKEERKREREKAKKNKTI